ncbi:hypothetical protein CCO02nite_08340 [Cellulomonas composti]|uniref:Uncharacterized protein n=1 Tax=Cellulomonas composti TaxID=266130 RepID=A0A511J847_9CELL|nr:hypothetical protein CCO02nite_08340 [Cellulomonas composti]
MPVPLVSSMLMVSSGLCSPPDERGFREKRSQGESGRSLDYDAVFVPDFSLAAPHGWGRCLDAYDERTQGT